MPLPQMLYLISIRKIISIKILEMDKRYLTIIIQFNIIINIFISYEFNSILLFYQFNKLVL